MLWWWDTVRYSEIQLWVGSLSLVNSSYLQFYFIALFTAFLSTNLQWTDSKGWKLEKILQFWRADCFLCYRTSTQKTEPTENIEYSKIYFSINWQLCNSAPFWKFEIIFSLLHFWSFAIFFWIDKPIFLWPNDQKNIWHSINIIRTTRVFGHLLRLIRLNKP